MKYFKKIVHFLIILPILILGLVGIIQVMVSLPFILMAILLLIKFLKT